MKINLKSKKVLHQFTKFMYMSWDFVTCKINSSTWEKFYTMMKLLYRADEWSHEGRIYNNINLFTENWIISSVMDNIVNKMTKCYTHMKSYLYEMKQKVDTIFRDNENAAIIIQSEMLEMRFVSRKCVMEMFSKSKIWKYRSPNNFLKNTRNLKNLKKYRKLETISKSEKCWNSENIEHPKTIENPQKYWKSENVGHFVVNIY